MTKEEWLRAFVLASKEDRARMLRLVRKILSAPPKKRLTGRMYLG